MEVPTRPNRAGLTPEFTRAVIPQLRLPSAEEQTPENIKELLQLFRLILDNIPQAVFWKDRDSVYLGCNRNFAIDAGVEIPEEVVGKTDFDLAWTTEQARTYREMDRRVIESGEPQYHIVETLTLPDGKTIWVETNKVPLFDADNNVIGILGTYRDITGRKQAQEALRESQQMLQLIMDNIPQAIFWKDRNSVYQGCNRNFAIDAGVGATENIVGKTDYDLPWTREEADWYREVDRQVMETGIPQYHIIETQFQADGKKAWVDTNKIPLHDANGNVVGILGTYEDITERKQTEEALQRAHAELEQRVKERTAELSAANAQLKQEIHERKLLQAIEREQRTLAEALRDTAALLNSTLDLDEVLDRILSTIGRVVPHDTASIILVEDDMARMVRFRQRGKDVFQTRDLRRRFPLEDWPNLRQMIETKEPLIVQESRRSSDGGRWTEDNWVRSYLGAPIQIEDEVIGFINLNSATPGFFTPLHAERLQAFADQAAIAIQNARLYERAQELAALEERQRLARDLHDAVSQTLWTASLMADVLPTLWIEDRAEGERVLQKFQRLTRGALAEMRTLLLELRPAALVEAKLDDLLHQLAEAMMSRKKIDVSLSVEGECSLPAEVQVGLYRIAQETLNNIAKHSRATHVSVTLQCATGRVNLQISDNGRGFEPTRLPPERLGLSIMRERAEAIGADLQIASEIGAGTQISIVWPGDKKRAGLDAPEKVRPA
ncbi:MAG: PAS domain S-box protein [Chloroflexi bacterium]|nr:MAG: PAS domain S-box protein [Chloroflexota bacterium]